MNDEYYIDSDYSDDYIVLNNTIYKRYSEPVETDSSVDGERMDDNNDTDNTSSTYIIKSDSSDSDIIEYIEQNTECITLLQEDITTYFQTQEIMIKGIIILLLGFIVLSIVRKTFDIFM